MKNQKQNAPQNASQGVAMQKVTVCGITIDAGTHEGKVWIVIRRVCEALGIDFSSQLTKLKGDQSICMAIIQTQIPGDDQRRELSCIDLRSFPLWIATIHPSKVAESSRADLIIFKREAGEVLAEHFLGPRTPPGLAPRTSSRPLTARQQEVFDYLRDYAKQFGVPPTIREIAARFGLSSLNAVHDHLGSLERKGMIRQRRDGRSRGIMFVKVEEPTPPGTPVSSESERMDRLERLVEKLVGAIANLTGTRRPRLAVEGQSNLPFDD